MKDDHVFDFWFEGSVAWHAVLEKKIHLKRKLLLSEDQNFSMDSTEPDASSPAIATPVIEVKTPENPALNYAKGNYPCDLQIEGLDSGDGSLQSQLLVQAILKGYPGFMTLKKHSIWIDADGTRISKSNKPINVEDLINGTVKANNSQQYGLGVDI
jgi:isoleucyl-tRNA synthetase